MRSLMVLLVLVLFCSVQMTSSAPKSGNVDQICCMEFSKKNIPVKQVKTYYRTSSICPTTAIVFQMISGREICVDPENTFVKDQIAKLDKKTTSASTTASTTASTCAASTTASASTASTHSRKV